MSRVSLSGFTVDGVSFSGNGNAEGSEDIRLVHAECSFTWSDRVARELKFLETEEELAAYANPPARWTDISFKTKLDGVNIIISPNKADLKIYEADLKIGTVSAFKFKAEYDKSTGLASNRRVSFKFTSVDPAATSRLGALIDNLFPGGLTSTAKLVYNDPKAEEDNPQPELPGTKVSRADATPIDEKPRGRKKDHAVN